MNPWYKTAIPREEVREGRSFSPDEFAIALEQVVAGTAPGDYREPARFFARTFFTRALREHIGIVLRRLSGRTANAAPVTTLVTQFGGGKTHTLTALYHIARAGQTAADLPGVKDLLAAVDLSEAPTARVGVFVGNAWDPTEGRETPWIDLARQLAGDAGVAALGTGPAKPPGTDALSRLFQAAHAPVLLLFDEVLNFLNRHSDMADWFYAFLQNLTVAITGAHGVAAVIGLPRSQIEMTDRDLQWQDRITKVVHRVAQDLIAHDESEISEVVRRRLFEDLGNERARRKVARTYAAWCFDRSERLPPEWTAVDSAAAGARAKEVLARRFEACYPFHPATLSVFRRKWAALPQFQQTRGALAMLAQWVSWAAREHFAEARREPLITLGSAPLHVPEFRSAVLGQLGETRLGVAIDADLAGETAHARGLDADAKGAFRGIHSRTGASILFESSGGQVEKVAHLPELRFALGEPDIETTAIDNAAAALAERAFFVRRAGTDGFRIHHQATLRKVVSDRRASLDSENDTKPAIRKLVGAEFERGAALRLVCFPENGAAIPDAPRVTLVVAGPDTEWAGGGETAARIAEWTRQRGSSRRLYPGAPIWCVRKPGRALHDRVETWLAWQRVDREVVQGLLGEDFDRADRAEVRARVKEAEEAARDEIWSAYRFAVIYDSGQPNGLREIDLGAGHPSAKETLCGRIVTALKAGDLLNETVGAGYIRRNWPPAFEKTAAWPLWSLRQSFLDGSLTRLIDPDATLRARIVEFVLKGEFALASGAPTGGEYQRLWFAEPIGGEEVAFEDRVFLLTRERAQLLRAPSADEPTSGAATRSDPEPPVVDPAPGGRGELRKTGTEAGPTPANVTLRLRGTIPPETWNRVGMKLVPKLRAGGASGVGIEVSVTVPPRLAPNTEAEFAQILDDLDLRDKVRIEKRSPRALAERKD